MLEIFKIMKEYQWQTKNNILFYTESDSTLNPQSIQQDVNQIKEKVVAGEFDGYFEGENDELEGAF